MALKLGRPALGDRPEAGRLRRADQNLGRRLDMDCPATVAGVKAAGAAAVPFLTLS